MIKKNSWGYVLPKTFPDMPSDWAVQLETYTSAQDQTELFVAKFLSPSLLQKAPKEYFNVLFCAHGFGEHLGRYWHLPSFLQSEFDGIFMMDHRGHGKSDGLRGDTPVFDWLVEDLKGFLLKTVSELKQYSSSIRVHLLGHSMGGLLCLDVISRLPFSLRSIMLSAPALQLKNPIPLLQKYFISTVGAISARTRFNVPVDPKQLSHDEMIWEAHQQDRLVHSYMTPRFFLGMQELAQQLLSHMKVVDIPMLFLLPGQDPLIDTQVSMQFAKGVTSPCKQIQEFPDFYHEPMNECGKEQVFMIIKEWLHKCATQQYV